MRVWVYVEGESDRLALNALWDGWRSDLRLRGWGIQIVATGGKHEFLRKIGERAAQRLIAETSDLVVTLPDLYPTRPFAGTTYAHTNVAELAEVVNRETREALVRSQGVNVSSAAIYLDRLLASALKYDLEMLLLAARDELRSVVGTSDMLGSWRKPAEDQNDAMPPKRVVQELFRTKSSRKRDYRETRDAPDVLRRVTNLRTVLFDTNNQEQCPVFRAAVDWIAERTAVPAYKRARS